MIEIQIRRLSKISTGLAVETVEMDTLPYKEAIRWTLITARDRGATATGMELYLRRGSIEYLLCSDRVVNLMFALTLPTEVFAPGDFRVCGRYMGTAAGDNLELYAYGVVQRDFPIE